MKKQHKPGFCAQTREIPDSEREEGACIIRDRPSPRREHETSAETEEKVGFGRGKIHPKNPDR
jgi:hypothetical protein